MRKLFEAIGKVTTMIMAIVAGCLLAKYLPLWLNIVLCVCAFVALVIIEMEK